MEELNKSEGTIGEKDKNVSESPEKAKDVEDVQTTIVDDESASFDESDKEDDAAKGTISEVVEEDEKSRIIKNLVSLVILLAGFALGSLFVDVAQFINGSGFSQKAVKDANVIVAGDKTWVAFKEPIVDISIITVSEDEMKDCADCDPTEVINWLKRFIPTMNEKIVVASSPEGQAMIEKYKLKTIPAYVFSSDIKDTSFYQGEASVLFDEVDENYVLNSAGLGIPVGKYLETPTIETTDPVLGNEDAPVKMFVFSDFQCPFCSKFYGEVRSVVSEYGEDKVVLIYKDLPLDFHAQAMNAANAARCAQDQDKFWEMADLLYGNQDTWGETEGTAAFKTLAVKLGLDAAKFSTCIDNAQFADLIDKDKAEADNFGISGTPASFINNKFISGVVSTDELKKMIDEQLEGK